ncbi:hypothetical protein [Gabonibacter massiliensis]|uniref:hypothetical protein n=1 Tax=Gabonibacter massiliensis TaxID=1720195 RepID=UPI00073E626A|nr:hypothetical protein [Gabonibacter massiliensis]
MKKRVFFIFILCWGILGMSRAQKFEPGEQAKGLADLKSSSVDYSTGTFNYTIPLFELSSGHFTLPVSLVYSAKGVKVDEQEGPYGMGWNLMCGGVVTRTIRGGMADDYYGGFLNETLDHTTATRKKVNTHKQDGESDLFTAFFNGRKVSFIEVKEAGQVVVKTLEKSNLLIEKIEDGYEITDESGVKYVFSVPEMTLGACYQDPNDAGNNIWNKDFVSSWYLSEIQIPGDDPIRFYYTDGSVVDYTSWNEMVYNYGKGVKERDCKIDRYQRQITTNIDNAKYFASQLPNDIRFRELAQNVENIPTYVEVLTEVQRSEKDGITYSKLDVIRIPTLHTTIDYNVMNQIAAADRIIGCLSDWNYISETCSGTMTNVCYVRNLLDEYIQAGLLDAAALRGSLTEILRYMRLDIEETTTKTVRKVNDFMRQSAKERRPDRIIWGANKIVFLGEGRSVTGIQWQNYKQDVVREVNFSYKGRTLSRLTIGNEKAGLLGYYNFDYYLDTLHAKTRDIWGYYNGSATNIEHLIPLVAEIQTNYPYVQSEHLSLPPELTTSPARSCNIDYAKAYSLRQITGTGGWKLNVNYELNEYNGSKYGGIRVKEVVLDDGEGNRDTTRYHYRNLAATGNTGSGVLALGYQTLTKELNYGSFSDKVLLSSVQNDEMAIVNTGNNGLFYQYVVEEQVGNGYTAHYFCVPQSFQTTTVNQRSFYPYWLHGLPLGTAVYDKQGRLLKLKKNRYSQALVNLPGTTYTISSTIKNEFFPGASLYGFSTQVEQLKSFRFFVDTENALTYMPNRNEPFYWNGEATVYFNPYTTFYVPNVQPRENMVVPDQFYKIYYGGATVLTGEVEYDFFDQESAAAGTPSESDFTKTSFTGKYNVTTRSYTYGNTQRTTPTSVVTTTADGTEYKQDLKVVMDAFPDNTSALLTDMRAANMLYLPVRTSTYVKAAGSTSFLLAGEEVTTYTDTLIGGKHYYLPSKLLRSNQVNPVSVASGSLNNYFTRAQSAYTVDNQLHYSGVGVKVEVAEVKSAAGKETYVYDEETGNRIFVAAQADRSSVAAIDRYRKSELKHLNLNELPDKGMKEKLETYYDFHQNLPESVLRDSFLSESWTLHKEIMNIVEDILQGKEHRQKIFEEAGKKEQMQGEYEMVWYRRQNNIGISRADYLNMIQDIVDPIRFDTRKPDMMAFLSGRDKMGVDIPGKLLVQKVNANKYRYKLLVERSAAKALSISVSWTFTKSGVAVGTGENTFTVTQGTGHYCMEGEIPVSAAQLSASLELRFSDDVLSAALCPDGIEFELTSLDGKGNVVCRTGRNGIIESREYDPQGRLLRARDKNGNILQEYHYHVQPGNH